MDNGQWINVSLNNYVDAYAGGTPSRFVSEFYGGTIPWISSGEVNQPYITDTVEKITEEGLKNSSAKWIPKGSVLIAMYGATAGQISKTKIDATSNQAVLAIVPKDGAINPDYLYYLLKHNKNNLLQLTRGSAQPNLNKNLIVNYPLSIVNSLPAQRHIARILSTADAVIEKTQAAIAKYKAIKQGMLQDLFTRGIDPQTGKLRPRYENAPEMYKPSKLGWIPREWEVNGLGQIGEFKNGVNKEKSAFGYGTLFVNIGDAYLDNLDCTLLNRVKVTTQEIQDYQLVTGDIIFVRSSVKPSGVGYNTLFAEYKEPVVFCGFMIRFRFLNKEEYLPGFYNIYFRGDEFRNSLIKVATVSANTNVNQVSLSQLNVIHPPKKEQEKVFKIIGQLNNKLQTEQTYLQKMQSIKKGLMEDLLSGKVKVKSGKLVDEVTEKVTEHN